MDQARVGGWSVFDNETKKLVDCGGYNYERDKMTYAESVDKVKCLMADLISKYKVGMVILEDIQFRANAVVFKKLAWLQGVLINYCVVNNLPFWLVQPSSWQSWCRKHSDAAQKSAEVVGDRKATKVLSLNFVKEKYNLNLDNDNIADAVCIGHYGVTADDINLETE